MKKIFFAILVCITTQMCTNNTITVIDAQTVSVDTTVIYEHIAYLASDELGGRFPGTEGCQKAIDYISEQFKKYNFTPLCENGLQEFEFTISYVGRTTKETISTANVVYYKKGTNLPDEYIVVGAHYDHLGMGGFGFGSRKPDTSAVHNGADDNASGVAAMLACAEILEKIETDRSIIFVAFAAEEKGLLGSKHFVEHAPVNLRQIKAMINLDMVGRLDSILTVSGTGTATQMDSLLSIAYDENYQSIFQLKRERSGFGPSDHTSFCKDSVPVLYFHTGIHAQYHTPEDDTELINLKGCSDISNFVISVIQLLSEKEQILDYQMVGNSQLSMGSIKTTLGIMPDHSSEGIGLRISGVRQSSVAERAGLLKNDIIMQIGTKKVQDIESYMKAMNTFKKGDSVEIIIQRKGEIKAIKVEL